MLAENGLGQIRLAGGYSRWLISGIVCLSATVCMAQELLEPDEGIMRYKLSNLRVEKGVVDSQIAFDYRRTQEGSGQPRLVVRTDQGTVRILGLPVRIEVSGTIRLRDMLARTREILTRGGGDSGFAFYFVVDAAIGHGPE